MRANDLIWSSVVNHYLLDRPAPPSDLLYWFEDGARIPAAFLKSYNRDLLLENRLKEPAGFMVGDVADRPRRDHHADAGDRAEGRSRLGMGSGLSAARATSAPISSSAARATMPASSTRRPPTSTAIGPTPTSRTSAKEWLETATRHEGSWWPWWTKWLDRQGQRQRRSPRASPKDPIEPAPGRYAMMP